MGTEGSAPGIREVASAAGVSVATVSNVLNSTGRFSDQTRERVEQAMRELGFVRNRSAFELRKRERVIIGLLVPNLANSFFAQLAQGVIDRAADRGLLVVVSDSAEDVQRETATLESLSEQQVEDIVVLPVRSASSILGRWTPPRASHIVFIDADTPASHCSVSADDVAGGALVLHHLVEAGATRIGCVAPGDEPVTQAPVRGGRPGPSGAYGSLPPRAPP